MTPTALNSSGRKITLLLSFAGLLSALCSICFATVGAAYLLAGFFFGAAMSICLMKVKILSDRQAFHLLVVAIVAQIFSVLAAFYIQLHLPLSDAEMWSMGHGEAVSPISLFVGGLVGGFLFLGEALHLLRPGLQMVSLAVRAFLLALMAGAFGVIGWALGPSLGTTISRLFYTAHFPGTVPVPYDPLYGYRTPAVEYSLYLIWQVCIAFVLGLMVQHYGVQARTKETE